MSNIVNLGEELVRINFDKNRIEYSTNDGRSWTSRYSGTSCGDFISLLNIGDELLAATSKGVYYSTNDGRSWTSRYKGSSCGNFEDITSNGKEILATTDKGLYYSTNDGRSWNRRS